MQSEQILKQAQEILNTYCAEECKSLCCRRGSLLLNKTEADTLSKKQNLFIKRDDGLFEFKLTQGCPHLNKNMLCNIHKNPNRPKLCGEYPFFVKQNTILVAELCPAVMNNILDPIIKKFKENNFKVLLI